MVRPQFSFTGAERHLLFLAQESAGPEASPQPSTTENAEVMQMPEEPTIELKDDQAASEEAQKAVKEEEEFIAGKNKRMLDAEQAFQKDAQPTYNPQKIREQASRRDNFERASGTLRHLKDMAFVIERKNAEGIVTVRLEAEKALHRAKKESLEGAIESQAYKAERKAENEVLSDTNSDRATGFNSRSSHLQSKVQTTSHESVQEYETYSKQMETYRAALSQIHIHPSHDAISFSAEAKEIFGLDDAADVMSTEVWNAQSVSSTPLVEKSNTGSPNEDGVFDEGNIVQEFIATNPEKVMKKIKDTVESYKEGGNILYTKEKMMINDAQHDDIPQSVEQVLDQAKLTEKGEWKFANGKEALEFIRNYTSHTEGDDFLDAEEKSWRIPTREMYRKEEDGAKIETEKRIAAFQTIAQEMGAGDKWDEIKTLLDECTVPIESPDAGNPLAITDYNNRTKASYENRDKIYELLYTASGTPEVLRAKKMNDDLRAFKQEEEAFLAIPLDYSNQASINTYQEQEALYKGRIGTLAKDYPELGIDATRLAYRHDRSLVDTPNLMTKAEWILQDSISNPRPKNGGQETLNARAAFQKIGDAITDITSSRTIKNYNHEEFEKETTRPTRRNELQTLLLGKEKEIKENGGALVLSNKEMDMFRAVTQRRVTQEVRVYRERVHDVTPDGITLDDPARMAKADATRILIPHRTEALKADITDWSTTHLEQEEGGEAPSMTPSARRGALETLDELRNSVKKHLLDSHSGRIPEKDDISDGISTVDKLMSDSWLLHKKADEIAPEDEMSFRENLTKASDILTKLIEDNEGVVPKDHDAEKLEKTFDVITDDNFVTLPELEDDLKALREERSALGQKEDSPEINALVEIINTARRAGATDDKRPMQAATMKGVNITFNRHGQVGIHKSNAKELLEKVHAERVVIDKFADTEIMALAEAQCPITVNDTTITPYQAQALRSYSGPNAVLTLPNITNISKEAIQYLAKANCHITLCITHTDEMNEDTIMALREFNDARHEVQIVLPRGVEISDWIMQNYEAVVRSKEWRTKNISLKNEGAIRLPSQGEIPETKETSPQG